MYKINWVPKLPLPDLNPIRLHHLKVELDKIHRSEDLAEYLQTLSIYKVDQLLLEQLLLNPLDKVMTRKFIEVNADADKPKFRSGMTCIGLWYKSHNQYLYRSMQILEYRHKYFFYLNKYATLNARKNRKIFKLPS